MIYTITLNPTIDRTMHFPKLEIGKLNRATRSLTDLSGKGVNVSVALRSFGLESVITGFAAGIYGEILVEGLRRQGYTCEFLQVPGETRSNITVIDEATGITTKLNEPGPHVSQKHINQFQEYLSERVKAGDICIFSGSLPVGAPTLTYAQLISTTKRNGALALIDTSGPALKEACLVQPDLVKPNTEEAEELVSHPLNGPQEIVAGAQEILRLGPRRVLLSMGPRGALFASEGEIWLAQPPKIKEVSAVGAGDAALAGALWAWLQGLPPAEIAHWATAAGTAAALKDGSAMPTMEQIKEIYTQVSLVRLDANVSIHL